jgi:DNA-binding transcriptional LysR family regulator
LHVLSVLALSYEILPRALKLFNAQHPNVAVTIDSLHSPQIVSSLVLQEADVGYVFSAVAHPSLEPQHLSEGGMVCVAPKGMLSPAIVQRGSVGLVDLVDIPVVSLDVGDPVGITLSQACSQMGVGLRSAVRVQTYHAALALAHHGLGLALVDACTAISADPSKVDVLLLEPQIVIPIVALRPVNRPSSLLATAMTRCVQQVVAQALGH